MDIHYQPEVAGEMHHCLRIDGWLLVEHNMERNSEHMGCNLEDNEGDASLQLVEIQEEVAELQLLNSAQAQQLGLQVMLEPL